MVLKSVISKLYNDVEAEKPSSKQYNELLSKCLSQREELEATLNEEQKQKLDAVMEIMHDMTAQETKEFFKIGFTLSAKLMAEAYCSKTD